jgi:hypothetical protein
MASSRWVAFMNCNFQEPVQWFKGRVCVPCPAVPDRGWLGGICKVGTLGGKASCVGMIRQHRFRVGYADSALWRAAQLVCTATACFWLQAVQGSLGLLEAQHLSNILYGLALMGVQPSKAWLQAYLMQVKLSMLSMLLTKCVQQGTVCNKVAIPTLHCCCAVMPV